MTDLFAVFVVVHAGQRAVWIPVDVRVHATCVPVTSPTHVTLHRERDRQAETEGHTDRERDIQTGSETDT